MSNKKWTADELNSKIVAIKPMSPSDEQRIYNKLIKNRISTIIGYPFFGYLVTHLKFTVDYTISTAATDGETFYYNPYYIDALEDPCVAFIMVHEIMHCALQHMTRRGSREPQKWNYACDYAIHSIIMLYINHWSTSSRQRNALKMPRNCLYNSKYDNMSSEQIYSLLPDNYLQTLSFGAGGSSSSPKSSNSSSSANEPQSNGNNADGGSGNNNNKHQTPLDDHSKWYTSNAQKDASIKARTWSGRMLTAAMQAESKKPGSMPGGLLRLIDRLTKPQRSWKQILMDYLQQEVNDFSWNRPDNRFTEAEFGDIKLPSFSETEDVGKDIIFYIDSSGSMSDEDINMCFSEIVGAANQFKLQGKVGFFDVRPTELVDFNDAVDLIKLKEESKKIMQGLGGGTDCKPCFQYLTKEYNQGSINVIIILSDGYLSWPEESIAKGIPVIWVICNQDKSVQPPWGKVIRLNPSLA